MSVVYIAFNTFNTFSNSIFLSFNSPLHFIMDFKSLLCEYHSKVSDRRRGEFWWKNAKWNQANHFQA